MPTTIDKEGVSQAYETVRADDNETTWALLSYDESRTICVTASGSDYNEFIGILQDDECQYGYVRVTSGDELSKRAKFVLITWCGPECSAMKKAKLSVEKGLVKSVIKNFAVEMLAEDKSEIEYDSVVEKARKAGGANYGTGVRS